MEGESVGLDEGEIVGESTGALEGVRDGDEVGEGVIGILHAP